MSSVVGAPKFISVSVLSAPNTNRSLRFTVWKTKNRDLRFSGCLNRTEDKSKTDNTVSEKIGMFRCHPKSTLKFVKLLPSRVTRFVFWTLFSDLWHICSLRVITEEGLDRKTKTSGFWFIAESWSRQLRWNAESEEKHIRKLLIR